MNTTTPTTPARVGYIAMVDGMIFGRGTTVRGVRRSARRWGIKRPDECDIYPATAAALAAVARRGADARIHLVWPQFGGEWACTPDEVPDDCRCHHCHDYDAEARAVAEAEAAK